MAMLRLDIDGCIVYSSIDTDERGVFEEFGARTA